MPAYHSALNAPGVYAELCGCYVLPLKTRSPGPAPAVDLAAPEDDIVDEAIRLFRANVLFNTFEIQGGADRVLAYLTLFIHQVIKRVATKQLTKADAQRQIATLASGPHAMPGDAGWPLNMIISAPKSGSDAESLRAYMKQLREAVVPRLLDRIFNDDGTPNKHWMLFSKRKFLNREFV